MPSDLLLSIGHDSTSNLARRTGLIALFACLPFGAALTQRQSADPRFDWFEYQGNDSVFQQLNAGPDQYLNPILPGFYPDPSIVRVANDYYLVTSSFGYFPGVPIFHSRDLVHWKQLGFVLDRPSQLNLDGAGISRGIFAPAINYHDGTFYLATTVVDRGGNFFVTASNPAGPWSDPVWLDFDGIDPSFFFDDDGRAYVVNNGPPAGTPLYDGHRALWIQQFDGPTRRLVGPRSVIVNGGVDLERRPIWIEGPHIFKVGNTYFLIAAEGGTAEQHSEVVFRSRSVLGPWEPWSGNPILTQRHLDERRPFPVTSAGHADFVQTQNGEWWAVFLGVRPYLGNHFNTGRETFLLPVVWRDGWPTILPGNSSVPYLQQKPRLPVHATVDHLKTGNFVERDDFDLPALKPYWQQIRTPRHPTIDLATSRGWLTLRARPDPLGSRAQPSFIGRRQQHARASATTALQYNPVREGDRAGLVAFYDENHYYCLCVTLADGRPVIRLEAPSGGEGEASSRIVASAPLDLEGRTTLLLRIVARGASYDFYYGTDPARLTSLASNVDGTFLSTKIAGGFVGAMFGLYSLAR